VGTRSESWDDSRRCRAAPIEGGEQERRNVVTATVATDLDETASLQEHLETGLQRLENEGHSVRRVARVAEDPRGIQLFEALSDLNLPTIENRDDLRALSVPATSIARERVTASSTVAEIAGLVRLRGVPNGTVAPT
jgi:hypothetical protein